MGLYLRPTDLAEALAALAESPMTVLAGGTDFYPARVGRPVADDILDVTALAPLRGIADAGDHLRIGATTRWSEIAAAELPGWFAGLKLAAREVGGVQIQNAGTIAGNLCNASPAADGVPPLLALDAAVELAARSGRRVLPLADFITGNRRTARAPDELMTAVLVPKPRHPARAGFAKLGARKYLVISIVMAAAVLEIADGSIAAARIAIGACSPVAQRLRDLEAALSGRRCAPGLGRAVESEHLAALAPIDDVRGTAAYRRDAARTVIARLLDELAGAAA
ncbi:MAG: FAD binding domain-containing protein [Stellaceae bacterium]